MSRDNLIHKFVVGLKEFVSETSSFNPEVFGDPLASKIEWTPLVSGGSSFQTHRLTRTTQGRVEFAATLGAKLFASLFLAVGLFLLALLLSGVGPQENLPTWILFFIGVVFSVVGGFTFYIFTKPIVFDQMRGYFWKGRKTPERGFYGESIKDCVALHRIHAIQLLKERCSSSKNTYYSYELNLVLDDGQRLSVVDHGNAEKLIQDAELLAEFLSVPVWNSIGQGTNL